MSKLDFTFSVILSVVVGILMGAVVSFLDTPRHIAPPPKGGYYLTFGFDANSLSRQLRRCQRIGIAAYGDTQCQTAWMEVRGQPDGCADFSVIGDPRSTTRSGN